MTARRSPAKLVVRTARVEDADELIGLHARVYPSDAPYSRGMFLGQISRYPDGQFVVEREGRLVGHARSEEV